MPITHLSYPYIFPYQVPSFPSTVLYSNTKLCHCSVLSILYSTDERDYSIYFPLEDENIIKALLKISYA